MWEGNVDKEQIELVRDYQKMNHFANLKSRSILSIAGKDASLFLQGKCFFRDCITLTLLGLITNNITKIDSGGDGLYTCFLASNGRVLYDAFIYPKHSPSTPSLPSRSEFLVEVDARIIDDLATHLKRYVLRKKVVMTRPTYNLYQIWGPDVKGLWGSVAPIEREHPGVVSGGLVPRDRFTEIGTRDPRDAGLGLRVLLAEDQECN